MKLTARITVLLLTASLNVFPAVPSASAQAAPFKPYRDAAIGPVSEASDIVTDGLGHPVSQGYQCDKPGYTDFAPNPDSARQIGSGTTATFLELDSRTDYSTTESRAVPDKVRGPGGTPVETPYWYDSSHYGAYTCEWVEPGVTYTVFVQGVYSYDQSVVGMLGTTAPATYGLADAECATGYPKGPEGQEDHYIPAHYRQPPADPAHPDLRGMDGESLYGREWKKNRFVVDNGLAQTRRDYLDLWIDWGRGDADLDWQPVGDTDNGCSINHTYKLEWRAPDSQVPQPIHFRIFDFREYNEWDNCGTLDISVQRGVHSEPNFRTRQAWDRCGTWAPAPYATKIKIGDGSSPLSQGMTRTESLIYEEINKSSTCATQVGASPGRVPDARACVTIPGASVSTSTAADEDTSPYWFYPKKSTVVGGSGPFSADLLRTVRFDFTGDLKHTASAVRVDATRLDAGGNQSTETIASRQLANINIADDPCAEIGQPKDAPAEARECSKYNFGEWREEEVTGTSFESQETIESMLFDSHPDCTRIDDETAAIRCGRKGDSFFWSPPPVTKTVVEGKRTVAYTVTFVCKVVHAVDEVGDGFPMIGTMTVIADPFLKDQPTVDPDLKVPDIVVPDGTGILPQKVKIAGTAPVHSTVILYDDGAPIARVPVGGTGNWEIKKTFISSGTHTVQARAVGQWGTISDVSEPVAFEVDAIVPKVSFSSAAGPIDSISLLEGGASDEGGVTRVMLKLIDPQNRVELIPVVSTASATSPPTSTTWKQKDNSYLKGTAWVQVIAFDGAGNVGESARRLVQQSEAIAAAATPRDLIALPGNKKIDLRWLPPLASPGGPESAVTTYKIYGGSTPEAEEFIGTVTAKTASALDLATGSPSIQHTFSHDNLPAGIRRFYRIRAVAANGESRLSSQIDAIPDNGDGPEILDLKPSAGSTLSRDLELMGKTEPLARVQYSVTFKFSTPYTVRNETRAGPQGHWSALVPLPFSTGKPVDVSAIVWATDIQGNTGSSLSVDFSADDTAPKVKLNSSVYSGAALSTGSDDPQVLSVHYGEYLQGVASDEVGLTQVEIVYSKPDGFERKRRACELCSQSSSVPSSNWGDWLNHLDPGTYNVAVTATDSAGNAATLRIILRVQARRY